MLINIRKAEIRQLLHAMEVLSKCGIYYGQQPNYEFRAEVIKLKFKLALEKNIQKK